MVDENKRLVGLVVVVVAHQSATNPVCKCDRRTTWYSASGIKCYFCAVGAVGGALGGFMGQPALARSSEDPMGGYVFALEINKMEVAHFTECAGLKVILGVHHQRRWYESCGS